MQPYPEFEIAEMAKDMGYSVAGYDDFPVKFNRTTSIHLENKHEVENLHKLFPLIVRFPWLMKLAPRLIKSKVMAKPYLILYMLYSEWMVAEQAQIYSSAQGLSGPRYWTITDFVYRLSTKGVLRVYQVFFARFIDRFFTPKQIQVSLQMGDERVVAHMD
jgi:hypothetical protein